MFCVERERESTQALIGPDQIQNRTSHNIQYCAPLPTLPFPQTQKDYRVERGQEINTQAQAEQFIFQLEEHVIYFLILVHCAFLPERHSNQSRVQRESNATFKELNNGNNIQHSSNMSTLHRIQKEATVQSLLHQLLNNHVKYVQRDGVRLTPNPVSLESHSSKLNQSRLFDSIQTASWAEERKKQN